MAIRKIREVPDPILYKKSREVEKVDERIKELINDLMDTMYESDGVGLAAVQVGVRRRVLVIDDRDGNILKMVNPEITFHEGNQLGKEGCLSVPGYQGDVERYEKVRVKYLDETGEEKEIEAEDFLARIIQHEYDHLEGIIYTDVAKHVEEQHVEEQLETEEI